MDNIIIGDNSGTNAKNIKNCLFIGENAGAEVVNGENIIRIGNFTKKEITSGEFEKCLSIDNGRVVIKLDVMRFILGKEFNEFFINNLN